MAAAFEYVDIVGISTASFEDAVQQAVAAASATRTVAGFEVVSTRGRVVEPSKGIEFQVTVRFGCKMS